MAEDSEKVKYSFKCLEQKCDTHECHIRPHVNVTLGDLSRWTAQGYIGHIIAGLRIVPPESENDPFVMATVRKPLKDETEGTACVFFDEEANGCTIRYSRPISCRTFPLDHDGEKYFLSNKNCPGVGQGEVSKEALKESRDLAEMEYRERMETISALPVVYSLVMAPMVRQSAEAMERLSEEDRKRMEEILSKSHDKPKESE
ncbi:MAG: YkgJ family cysteine cluster protein [Candidatus Thorarchaeota archaeon]